MIDRNDRWPSITATAGRKKGKEATINHETPRIYNAPDSISHHAISESGYRDLDFTDVDQEKVREL